VWLWNHRHDLEYSSMADFPIGRRLRASAMRHDCGTWKQTSPSQHACYSPHCQHRHRRGRRLRDGRRQHLLPPSSIKDKSMLESSSLTTKCPWKGTASYYYPQSRQADIQGRGMVLPGAERECAEHQGLRCVLYVALLPLTARMKANNRGNQTRPKLMCRLARQRSQS
jgi:hypothetical protein